jgi:tyrosyl-tRNA synthetase
VHAIATPLLTKADGTKFGKTEGGSVWLAADMTSPYAFHQFFLNAEDEKVIDYLKVFSPRSREEIAELEQQTKDKPHLRAAQRALADDVTTLVHGEENTIAAKEAASALFGRSDLATLSDQVVRDVAEELKAAEIGDASELPSFVDAMEASGVVASKSAARRAIAEGGAYLNNEKVTDPERRIAAEDLLAGRYVIVRRGKKTAGAVRIGDRR